MKKLFKDNRQLLPAIIQDARSGVVLMLGYMNEEAYQKTIAEGRVTFFSRSRQRLWTKGETSGNFLDVVSILTDCDADTILVKAHPAGPVCHTGQDTCFNEANTNGAAFLNYLEQVIAGRKTADSGASYTAQLFRKGVPKIAQKVGEEATEVVIEAVAGNKNLLAQESADLLYHLLVLLQASGLQLSDVTAVLESRHK